MFDNRHVDEVEDADDVYSVEWVRSFLESNPVWLFNAELLSKIGNKASEHVSICSLLLPNLKTRHRYNTGIDFKQTEWYKLLQNPMLLQPESYIARQFQRRYRLPYACFLDLINDVKEYNTFNLNNVYIPSTCIFLKMKS